MGISLKHHRRPESQCPPRAILQHLIDRAGPPGVAITLHVHGRQVRREPRAERLRVSIVYIECR